MDSDRIPFQLLPNAVHPANKLKAGLRWQTFFAEENNFKTKFAIYCPENKTSEKLLKLQSYKNYQITQSLDLDVDYYFILNQNSFLHPQSLFILAKRIQENPVDLYYFNEVRLGKNLKNAQSYFRRTDLNKYSLLSWNMAGDSICISKRLLERLKQTTNPWQIATIALEQNLKTEHLPLALIHSTNEASKTKSYSFIKDYAKSIGVEIEESKEVNSAQETRLVPKLKRQSGSIQIIIPFKDQANTTIICLKSIAKQNCLADLKITLVDNNSTESELKKISQYLEGSPLEKQTKIISDKNYFNYARLNNLAAKEENTDFILFLNNDVELTNDDAISELRSWCALSDVGAVGGTLCYPDGSIQHAGINFASVRPANISSSIHYSDVPRACNAVTFAMALVKREAYNKIDGLDEKACPNGFGDALFCLELGKEGYQIIHTPEARGTHYESKSRGSSPEELELLEMVEHGLPIPDLYPDFTAKEQPMHCPLSQLPNSKLKKVAKKILSAVLKS